MANENLTISQNGINLIKKWEGVRLTAYQDSVGVWTIGYGHTKGVYAGMKITQAQADQFLKEDIKSHVYGSYNYVTTQLNQNQFDALASFQFNLGAYILSGTTLLTYINSRQWQKAADEMKLYNKAGGVTLPGLVNRRNEEAALFMKASIGPTPNASYYQSGSYFVALQDLQPRNKSFDKNDNTWFIKAGSKFAVRERVFASTGACHAQLGGLLDTYVTMHKDYVKPQ